MGRAIVIANQKGGMGKTTTTINLAASFAELGETVLAVDLDPQGNTTSGFGVDKNSLEKTVYDLLIGASTLSEVLLPDVFENLSLLPANIALSGAEVELVNVSGKEFLLRDVLAPVKKNYDFILIDCPPSLTLLTINALCAGDTVLVPLQCEYYALEGLSQLMQTIDLVRERLNPGLKIEGVVFTMYDSRTKLSTQVVENVKANLDQPIFESVIPRNVRLAEAPSYGLPITVYAAESKGADAYRALAGEILRRC